MRTVSQLIKRVGLQGGWVHPVVIFRGNEPAEDRAASVVISSDRIRRKPLRTSLTTLSLNCGWSGSKHWISSAGKASESRQHEVTFDISHKYALLKCRQRWWRLGFQVLASFGTLFMLPSDPSVNFLTRVAKKKRLFHLKSIYQY